MHKEFVVTARRWSQDKNGERAAKGRKGYSIEKRDHWGEKSE